MVGARLIDTNDGKAIVWLTEKKKKDTALDEPWRYVVYRFDRKEKVNLDDPSKIITITSKPFYNIPKDTKGRYTYVVTVLDRMQNESKGVKCKVKL